MTALFFSLAFFAAAAILVGRWAHKKARERAWRLEPGHSPENAIAVSRFDEMDAFLVGKRCPCGGRLTSISEGGATTSSYTVRVLHLECVRCQREHDFFFDLTHVAH